MTPAQWTDANKEVMIVRQCAYDGSSSHEFRYPLVVGETAAAPDWDPVAECGHGLHGWPWGLGIGDGAEPNYVALWQVYAVSPVDVVDLGGKVKFRAGRLVYSGQWYGALAITLAGRLDYIQAASSGSASATGDRGSASATGDRGSASATGYSGSASATGSRGSASATGSRGSASATGELATVEVGRDGVAVLTTDEGFWIARRGAVFVQSWEGYYVATSARELGAADGERFHWRRGKIVGRSV